MAVGVLGKTDTARISNAFKARGNVDAVAHQVAIALLDHVAQMDADAELDATLRRKTRVAMRPLCTAMVGSIRSLRSGDPETRSLLAADVVGFSKLAGSDEERTLARLRARWTSISPGVKRTFRSVVDAVRCAIEMQNGMIEHLHRVVVAVFAPAQRTAKRIGVLLRARLAEPAAAAGTGTLSHLLLHRLRQTLRALAQGMIERNAGLPPERRIEFRVGIHLGDVVEESDGDLMGDSVNIAARLEGIADPGGICLSEDAYRHGSPFTTRQTSTIAHWPV